MSWMKRICRLVGLFVRVLGCNTDGLAELDALELEVEEEGPSYLSDLNKVPDFVDEAPVEVSEVRYPASSAIAPRAQLS